MARLFAVVFLLVLTSISSAADGNRLAYLDGPLDPYYPHRDFPKLITPQWVGEEGVECVVTLAIDDMREPAKYEAFLRPILDRLKTDRRPGGRQHHDLPRRAGRSAASGVAQGRPVDRGATPTTIPAPACKTAAWRRPRKPTTSASI